MSGERPNSSLLERPLVMTTTDLDIALDMTLEEHIETALLFLAQSQQELAAGDMLQGCEKLWGAAAHASMAMCRLRGWPLGDHRSLKLAIEALVDGGADRSLRAGFGMAEKFHANFYHNFMQDYELERDPVVVHEFVEQLLSMVPSFPKE